MYKVELLPTAWKDLESIQDWYVELFGYETSKSVTDNILNTVDDLALFPNMGRLTPDTWLNEQGYKMIVCEKHIIIYRLHNETVYVYHITDTRTDYQTLFDRIHLMESPVDKWTLKKR